MQATSECLQLVFDTRGRCIQAFCYTSHLVPGVGPSRPLESCQEFGGVEERRIDKLRIGT